MLRHFLEVITVSRFWSSRSRPLQYAVAGGREQEPGLLSH